MDNKRFYQWLNEQIEEQTEFSEISTANPHQRQVAVSDPEKKRTVTLKPRLKECFECGLLVDRVRRRYSKSKANTWIEWCVTCQRYRNQDTGRFDHIEPFGRYRNLQSAVNNKKANHTDKDDD